MLSKVERLNLAGTHQPQLPHLPEANILTEPARRNTAPAIAVCCYAIESIAGDAVIAVLASDHFIADEAEFAAYRRETAEWTAADLVGVSLLGGLGSRAGS